MQEQHSIQQSLSQPALLLLACLITEPKTAMAWYEAVGEATEQRIEPGTFSWMVQVSFEVTDIREVAISREETDLKDA